MARPSPERTSEKIERIIVPGGLPGDGSRRAPLRWATVVLAFLALAVALPLHSGESIDGTASRLWSFEPLRAVSVPRMQGTWGGARNPIDAFVLRKLEEAGLEPSPEADRLTLVRRLSLDLLGLPPSPREIEAFLADASPLAHERLVDRLLASPRYGERWGRHWLDVARFAESHGFEMNRERPNAYPYRDYVIAAFNEDLPYDRFVREQLAGDALGAGVATGFLVGGGYDQVKSPDINLTLMQRQDELTDIVNTTGTTFLGLTLGCARCHDHKFDPVLQRDFYRVQAIFAGVRHGERWTRQRRRDVDPHEVSRLEEELARTHRELRGLHGLPPVSAQRNEEQFAPVRARRVRFTILETSGGQACLDELEVFATSHEGAAPRNLALAQNGARARSSSDLEGYPIHKLAHVHDGKYGNERSWICGERQGWVEIELPREATIDRIVWGRDREGQYSDRLATRYRIEVATAIDGESDDIDWELVASDEARRDTSVEDARSSDGASREPDGEIAALRERLEALQEELRRSRGRQLVYAGTFEQPGATHILYRGDPRSPRDEVAPGALTALGDLELEPRSDEQNRRRHFANWIASTDNPLTARVMVNRLWHYHFGTGIVATPSDFGRNGARPSHPDLLDWLAGELIRSGWSIKHVQRLIVSSATFRQSSRPRATAEAIDAQSRLLWRFPPRRLEAEAIRDAMLATSGNLDLRMGGPGFLLFDVVRENVRHYFPREEFGPDQWRRMVYMMKIRQEQDDVFGAFDCPDGNQAVPRRTRSTTPLQALNLLNGKFVVEQAKIFARRVRADCEARGDDDPIRRAFRIALGRAPDATEAEAARAVVGEHGLEALCRALFNSSEFLFLP